MGAGGGGGGGGGWAGSYRKGPMLGGMKPAFRAKAAPKQQQVHYCEVCRISCAGPQTYREHLEGQKHKKKEAMMKSGGSTPIPRGVNALKCELCDVDCTGSDAYAAHIRGARHQKVVKLHTKLGKPIPSQEPVVQGKAGAAAAGFASTSGTGAKKLVSSTPKINFVATGNLGTVGVQGGTAMNVDAKEGEEEDVVDKDVQPVGQDYIEEIKNEDGKQTTFTCKLCDCRFNDPNAKEMHLKGRRHRMQYKKKVNPELVVEVKQTTRQRKQQDEKARRQQFQQEYLRRRDEERERMMMRGLGLGGLGGLGMLYEDEERLFWEERRRYEEEMECYEWYRRYGRGPMSDPRGMPMGPPMGMSRPFGPPGAPSNMPMPFFPPAMRRPDSMEDRYVMARHTDIYPKEDELEAVQKIVSHTEKALKFVSDHLAEEANKAAAGTTAKPGAAKPTPAAPKPATPARPTTPAKNAPMKKEDGSDGSLFSFQQGKEESSSNLRVLKGVMRVGVLAKGLLLHGDTAVNLVVLCSEKPTRSLLYKVHENLPKQLQVVAPEDSYSVKHKAEDAALVVIGGKEPHITVTITLTSPVMRETLVPPMGAGAPMAGAPPSAGAPAPGPASAAPSGAPPGQANDKSGDSAQAVKVKDPPDVLDKQKCLEALAALRHAKWFQARATQLQSCVMIIRILRDLCQRVPTWAPLHSWAMELLVEKVLSSTKVPLSPGEALRRVLEALASGILLPGGPGLLDLCEKEPVDAAGSLNAQQREDITASAQQALRLLAFRQIHKVLGMDLLPPIKSTRPRFPRKRRREGSGGEGNDSEAVDGKKDKKDETKMETESSK